MYTIILEEGNVYRDSDGKIVAPCQSADDPDFVEYNNWANNGGQPTVYITGPYVQPPQ
jgi:hypothetical protein